MEAVRPSTCNRVELYAASQDADCPAGPVLTAFLARFHGLDPATVAGASACALARKRSSTSSWLRRASTAWWLASRSSSPR